jgi:hypothetical protein
MTRSKVDYELDICLHFFPETLASDAKSLKSGANCIPEENTVSSYPWLTVLTVLKKIVKYNLIEPDPVKPDFPYSGQMQSIFLLFIGVHSGESSR